MSRLRAAQLQHFATGASIDYRPQRFEIFFFRTPLSEVGEASLREVVPRNDDGRLRTCHLIGSLLREPDHLMPMVRVDEAIVANADL